MKNDKKKIAIVAALAVVIVAVGAFQLVGSSSAKPVAATKTESKGAEAEKAPARPKDQREVPQSILAMAGGPLSQRDPFQPPTGFGDERTKAMQANNSFASGPANPPAPVRTGGGRTGGGSVAPLDPLPSGMGGPSGPMALSPSAPLRAPGEFAYQVKGVIVGERPMAVFEDDNGNQRLVPLGGSVDGDSKVVGIEKGRVTVRHKGKAKTLTLSEGQ
jgi:hypothetical protein